VTALALPRQEIKKPSSTTLPFECKKIAKNCHFLFKKLPLAIFVEKFLALF